MNKYVGILCMILLAFMSSCQQENKQKKFAFPPFLIWGFSIEGFPISRSQLEKLEQETKLSAQLIQFYLQWPEDPSKGSPIIPSLNAIDGQGAIPCLTWEPMFVKNKEEIMISSQDILDGKYDSYLIQVAYDIKQWQKPLIIRLAQEMNIDRYHWGTTKDDFGPQAPEAYINLFKYVVDLFNQEGVRNVLWAFCPNVDSLPNEPWNKANKYYPGDEYVDILGMDGYNWDISPELANLKQQSWARPWVSFEQLFQPLYQELQTLAPYKPILVFEVASVDREKGQKGYWIQEALAVAKKWDLVGLVWFQVKKEEDWRVNQNDNYSYIPIVKSATNPFNNWLANYLQFRSPPEQEASIK